MQISYPSDDIYWNCAAYYASRDVLGEINLIPFSLGSRRLR